VYGWCYLANLPLLGQEKWEFIWARYQPIIFTLYKLCNADLHKFSPIVLNTIWSLHFIMLNILLPTLQCKSKMLIVYRIWSTLFCVRYLIVFIQWNICRWTKFAEEPTLFSRLLDVFCNQLCSKLCWSLLARVVQFIINNFMHSLQSHSVFLKSATLCRIELHSLISYLSSLQLFCLSMWLLY